jgi:ketosteroid isomerase-like protein
MKEAAQPLMDVMEAYRAAVLAKDVDAFVALYDRGVRVFDLWSRWAYDGLDEWRQAVSGWFGSLGTERVAVEFDDLRAVVTAGLAVGHMQVTYRGLSAEGEELRAMVNRLTWGLAPADDGGWKIIHEHTSAPADLETSKVILVRSDQ